MLDVLEGSLERVFDDRSQMAAVLGTEEGQDRYLLSGLAFGAERRLGLVPGPAQVLAWRLPPVLGAPVKVENLQLMDFEVYLSLQGQLHRQLKDLPPGARITDSRTAANVRSCSLIGPVAAAYRLRRTVSGPSRVLWRSAPWWPTTPARARGLCSMRVVADARHGRQVPGTLAGAAVARARSQPGGSARALAPPPAQSSARRMLPLCTL